ncbi:DUF6235 family protein [Amycolatopsis sp. Hca4]|uniref:DUF6235 family protein n=1 Tax=unclassified Amycolatopsis TaxID=2618356 RepID=UPI000CA3C02F|nr:DUF6235 family protein [Amycolatopsis sp. Hca4]ATV95630.1 hypothetical protein [Amycolatopsis sp.]QKV75118.1 hypothetical protein HUT10_16115 [Amycolatopsis sp. Hca4]
MAMHLRLAAGVELLDKWAESATQAERNVLYEALFAIGDGSVFLIYDVFGDPDDISNFMVMVKADLLVKINVQRAESSFDILYVGTLDDGAAANAAEIAAELAADAVADAEVDDA